LTDEIMENFPTLVIDCENCEAGSMVQGEQMNLLVGVNLVGLLGKLGAVVVESLLEVSHFQSAGELSCSVFSILCLKCFLHMVILLFDFEQTSHRLLRLMHNCFWQKLFHMKKNKLFCQFKSVTKLAHTCSLSISASSSSARWFWCSISSSMDFSRAAPSWRAR
jgi:hypothetical protein